MTTNNQEKRQPRSRGARATGSAEPHVGYSIGQLARLSGVTERTLRYYESRGLLEPGRGDNGYRRYAESQVDCLQQILLYRELEVPLDQIETLLASDEDPTRILMAQRAALAERRERLDVLIATIDRTIDAREKGLPMSAADKMDGFVKKTLEENDRAYGDEIRERYGEERYQQSNEKLGALDKEGYQKLMDDGEKLYAQMAACMQEGNAPESEEAQALVRQHHAYLGNFGDFYTDEVYASLGRGYASDPRFRSYYDGFAVGLADWLAQAIAVHCEGV